MEVEIPTKGPICVVGCKTTAVTKRSEQEQLYTSWVDRGSVGGDSCSQFVDSENFGHYDGDIRERKGDPQRSTRRGMILTQIGGGYVTLSREKLKCGGCMVLPHRTCSDHASIHLPRRKTETRDLQDPEPSQRRLSRYPRTLGEGSAPSPYPRSWRGKGTRTPVSLACGSDRASND